MNDNEAKSSRPEACFPLRLAFFVGSAWIEANWEVGRIFPSVRMPVNRPRPDCGEFKVLWFNSPKELKQGRTAWRSLKN